ncbi:bacteriocin-type signal sequence [Streptococcus marmotae]|uniref:bacteriocin-type signal sequence n=1 Tax=Streptococcus marmotae TaxID=1825069 RepID=UPI000834DF67|nr:bacteriocin-type signal sequence [Streptococcus marmotae]
MNTITFDSSVFTSLTTEELMAIEAGANWDRVFTGGSVYLGATMAVVMATNPIGWGAGAVYLATCAASGAYMGYGLAT